MGRLPGGALVGLLLAGLAFIISTASAAEPERRAIFTNANLFAAGDVSFEDDFLSKRALLPLDNVVSAIALTTSTVKLHPI